MAIFDSYKQYLNLDQEKPQLLIYSYKLKYSRVCEKSVDIRCK